MSGRLSVVPSKRGFDACLVDQDGIAVAHVCNKRDVPLLSAAPELLEALEGLLSFAEAAETKALVGDEGCLWPVEQARVVMLAARGAP